MAEIIQTFFTYAGLTLFLGGIVFCFVAPAFRYGVFCTVLGNLLFVSAIVFPKQMGQFVETYELGGYFTSVDLIALKEKAVITGLILMSVLWIVRWFKHLVVEGFFVFLFPSLARPVVKEEKKKRKKSKKKEIVASSTEEMVFGSDVKNSVSKDFSESEELSHENQSTEQMEGQFSDSKEQTSLSEGDDELPVIRVRG